MKWFLLFAALCVPVSAGASVIGKGALEIGASGAFSHQSFENSEFDTNKAIVFNISYGKRF